MIESQPRPNWATLPREGCVGIEYRVLLASDGIVIANLRFAEDATIDEHSAVIEIDVICIAGKGFTSVGNETFAIEAGQTIRWSKDIDHCLWTEKTTMETLMIERRDN